MIEQRTLSIFGATGSVGLSTLDLVRQHRDKYRIVALTANGNAAELAKLAKEFEAEIAVVADEAAYPALKDALAGTATKAAAGPSALIEAAQMDADWTMAAKARPPCWPRSSRSTRSTSTSPSLQPTRCG